MTKFLHIRNPQVPKGGVTVAYETVKVSYENTDTGEVVLNLGLAFCSPLDRYSKAKGRTISTTRLRTRPLQIIYEGMNAVESHRIRNDLTFLLDHLTTSLEWTVSNSAINPKCMRCSTHVLLSDFKNFKLSVDARAGGHLGWVSTIPAWAPNFVREACNSWQSRKKHVQPSILIGESPLMSVRLASVPS